MEFQAAGLQEKKLELRLKPAPLHCIGSVKKVAPHQIRHHNDKKNQKIK